MKHKGSKENLFPNHVYHQNLHYGVVYIKSLTVTNYLVYDYTKQIVQPRSSKKATVIRIQIANTLKW